MAPLHHHLLSYVHSPVQLASLPRMSTVILGKLQQQESVILPTLRKPLFALGSNSFQAFLFQSLPGVSEPETLVTLFFLLNMQDLLLSGPFPSAQSQIT